MGFRLGSTDVTHPLLTSVYCPFNLLRLFKEGAHRSKTYIIHVSDKHALRVLVWDPRKHYFLLKDKFMLACLRKRSKKMCENYICWLQRLFRNANACVSETRMISVLLRWAPSLNNRSKLKGQYTDVKSGCVTSVSVRPSLNPYSLSLKTFLVLLSSLKAA